MTYTMPRLKIIIFFIAFQSIIIGLNMSLDQENVSMDND